jgi:hypothetical protein
MVVDRPTCPPTASRTPPPMNGAVARLQLVEPEIPDVSDPSEPTEIEQELGRAVVTAAGFFGQGLLEFWSDGKLDPATKKLAGAAIGALVMRRLNTVAPIDWHATVRREGMRALRACDPVAFREHEHTIGEMLGHLIALVDKVAAIEATFSEPMPPGRN